MIFPGLDAARRFSDKIWLVDGGKKWKLMERYPVRILVLTDQKVNILLKAISKERNESILLLDGAMEALPYDEAKIILNNMAEENSKVYSFVSSISIEKPGRYTLQATVTETETNRTLFTGTARVTVK